MGDNRDANTETSCCSRLAARVSKVYHQICSNMPNYLLCAITVTNTIGVIGTIGGTLYMLSSQEVGKAALFGLGMFGSFCCFSGLSKEIHRRCKHLEDL